MSSRTVFKVTDSTKEKVAILFIDVFPISHLWFEWDTRDVMEGFRTEQ